MSLPEKRGFVTVTALFIVGFLAVTAMVIFSLIQEEPSPQTSVSPSIPLYPSPVSSPSPF